MALCVAPLAAAQEERPVYGPKDEQAKGGFDSEVLVLATYAKRARELASDYDRSGLGAAATLGYELPTGDTVLRLEVHSERDKYAISARAEAEVRHKLSDSVTLNVSASGTSHGIVLESLDADQLALRGGIAVKSGKTTLEAFGRHRWRRYNDLAAGTGQGWQLGGKLHQRFGSWHWLDMAGAHDRIDDGGGRHGYRRTVLALDYSRPIAGRLRLLAGTEYRQWTYDARWIADNPANPLRRDRLVRPELGLGWGRTKGFRVRATAGYDFYRSNDPRFSGDGPRLRMMLGYRM